MKSLNSFFSVTMLVTTSLSAQAASKTYVETQIVCKKGENLKIVFENSSFVGLSKRLPYFDFAPFVTHGRVFKRVTDVNGAPIDVTFLLDVNLQILNTKRDFIADYNSGISNIVFTGITPKGYPIPGGSISAEAFQYWSLPATTGSAVETDLNTYLKKGSLGLVKASDTDHQLAFPFDSINTGDGARFDSFATTTIVMIFPETRGAPQGKALFSPRCYRQDGTDLILSGHFDVPGGLPPESDLATCSIAETRKDREG